LSSPGRPFKWKNMNDELPTNLKFIGYARKSSEDNKERQAASLPDQIYIIEGIRAKQGLEIVEVLQESKSAYGKGRELFEQMINRIENGEANAILTWHPNRLARNMTDGGRIIDLMDMNRLVEVRTPSRSYHNTPEDKFMLNLEFSLSKKDSDDKSVVVVRGLEKKAREGWRPGEAPQGYLNDKTTESGLRHIFIDPDKFPFIQKIFQMYYEGTSVNEIYRIAKDVWGYRGRQKKRSGGKPLCISMIYRILSNPFYCGRFEYPEGGGKWYDGKHDKAVSGEVFDEIQVRLGRRSQYHLKSHQFAFTGSLVHCGLCDSAIVAEEKWQCICSKCKLKFSITRNNRDKCTGCGTLIPDMDKPTILDYIYYRCGRKKNPACREKAIRIDRLEGQIVNELSTVDISPDFMKWAIKQILEDNKNQKVFREDAIENVKQAHDGVRAKLDNLLQLKISPGNKDGSLLSDEGYKTEKDKLEAELKNLEGQFVDVDNKMIKANDQTEKAFTFAERAIEKFNTTDDLKVKRDIFMGLGLHLTLQEGNVRFDGPEYLTEIKKMKKEAPIIGKRVAPTKSAEITALTDESFSSIPTLLRSRELNPAWKIMSLPCSRTLPRI
jgi:site-specific DNA recombinase